MFISVCLCLCVYICLCVCVFVWEVMHRHMCVHAYGIQRPTLGIRLHPLLFLNNSSPNRLNWLRNEPQEFSCLCLLKTGWDYKNAPLYLTFKIITSKVSLGIELMFLGLQTKHLINWTVFPALSTVSCHSSTWDGHHLIEVRSILMKISFTLLTI